MELLRLEHVVGEHVADINALLEELSPGHGTLTLERAQEIAGDANVELWVMQDAGHIVGTGTLILMPKLSGRAAAFDDVVVSAACRGRGLGRMLMQKLIERAKARRARHIDLTSRPSRTAANALYQKLGFEKRETNAYRMKL